MVTSSDWKWDSKKFTLIASLLQISKVLTLSEFKIRTSIPQDVPGCIPATRFLTAPYPHSSTWFVKAYSQFLLLEAGREVNGDLATYPLEEFLMPVSCHSHIHEIYYCYWHEPSIKFPKTMDWTYRLTGSYYCSSLMFTRKGYMYFNL